jgi:hypothetical protein
MLNVSTDFSVSILMVRKINPSIFSNDTDEIYKK